MSRNLTILVGITLAGFALVGCSKNITGPQVGNDRQVGTLNAVAPVKEMKEFEVTVPKNLYPETNTQNQMQAAAVEEIKKEDLGSNDTDEIAPKLRKQLESGSVAQKMEAAAAVPVTEKQKEDGSDNDTDELAPKLRKQLEGAVAPAPSSKDAEIGN